MSIQVKNITKKFKDFVALDNVNLTIQSGELLALLGPSGSGKTTLLRIISGLEIANSGTILFDGKEAEKNNIKDRHVGFVFQHYALFKHMTVFENVAFGLRVRKKPNKLTKEQIHNKVMRLLELVHLDKFYDRYPAQLSGGQRQRVALARALAVEPKVLLLDEPFGALDSKVRKELRMWMRKLHDDIHITSVFVTHDQEEAMEVSDRVVVMNDGRIEQVGTPEEVYHTPANSFIYDFLGNYNSFEGWKDNEGNVHITDYEMKEKKVVSSVVTSKSVEWFRRYPEITSFFGKILPGLAKKQSKENTKKTLSPEKMKEGKPVRLFARPHEMFVDKEIKDHNEYIKVKVLHINPAGALVKLELERTNGEIIQAETPKDVLDKLSIKKRDIIFVRPRKFKVYE